MSPFLIRYTTHAATLHRLGHTSVIPIIEGQKRPDTAPIDKVLAKSWPDVADGQILEDVEKIATTCPTGDGIGCVMDGRYVAIDNDIKIPPEVSPRDKRRISLASRNIGSLIKRNLGQGPIRHSEGEKRLHIYAQAEPNSVQTITGETVEIFASAKSKQVVLYGRHPSGNEYRWENDKGPANTGFSELPKVTLEQVYSVWEKIFTILTDEGLNRPKTSHMK